MSRTPARRGHINWRPFAPDAPFPPPPLVLLPAPLRAILQLPRGTQSSARAFAERGGLLSSVPRDLSASRESNEKEVWESAFAPSPTPSIFPQVRAPKPKTVARNSPIPRRFIAFVDRKARRGPHARAPLSLPHQGRDTHREKGQGGGLCAQRIPRRDYFRARFSIPLNSSNAALLLCVRTISAHYLFRLCPWTRSTRDLVGSRFFREMERGNRLERYIYSFFSFHFGGMDRWLVDFKKWWFVVVIFSAFLFIFSSKQRRRKCKENVYFFHFDPRGRLLVFYCFVAFPGYCEYILLFILYFLIYPSKDARKILKEED